MRTVTDYTKLEKFNGKYWLMNYTVLKHEGFTYKTIVGFKNCERYLKNWGVILNTKDHQAIFITNDPDFKFMHAYYSTGKQYIPIKRTPEIEIFMPAFNLCMWRENP